MALTILLKPFPMRFTQQFWLIACVAVAVRQFFAKYAGDDTKIKWPNDLYWQDRKAGGILVESVAGNGEWRVASGGSGVVSQGVESGEREPSFAKAMEGKWIIIGIGINVNQVVFSDNLPNPVSLKQITGKEFSPVELAKELQAAVMQSFRRLGDEGFDKIYEEYLSYLYKRKETVKLKKGNRVFEARIQSVSPSGKLVVMHSVEEEFDFGEIEMVLA